MYTEANKVASQIDNPDYADRILQIQTHIQYELEEFSHAR
jgi:hypothetical protein